MDQVNFTAWENRVESRTGGVSSQMAAMARATLPEGGRLLGSGDPLPPLWHWFGFLPQTPTQELGGDGHPPLGDFLPPVPQSRRMWAGGHVRFLKRIHVDEMLVRTSTLRSVTRKQGRTGDMVFVTVDHEITGEGGLAITERQDIVYLPVPDRYTPPRKLPAPVHPVVRDTIAVPPTLLFRYSAITFNAHRIHYDLPYAQQVEHYPGLVVHGPLQATLLVALAERHRGRAPDQFEFRGVHPVFAGGEIDCVAVVCADGGLDLCTCTEGHQGMQARATWEDDE